MITRVIFHTVKDAQAKLDFICQRAEEAMRQEERLLIAVPTDEAAQYIEALLWRQPETSFIPHVITQSPTTAWVAITSKPTHNFNQASILLNLCSEVPPLYSQFNIVYELDDQTHPQKATLSEQRRSSYAANGIQPHN